MSESDESKNNSGYFKTGIYLEVLSNHPINELDDIESIIHQSIEGNLSMQWYINDRKKLSAYEMANALLAQDSEPEFLVENGWKYILQDGDEIQVPEGKGFEVKRILGDVCYTSDEQDSNNDVICFRTVDGQEYSLRVAEIS